MNITRVGVGIAKSVFRVHGVDRQDRVQWRGKYARGKWLGALVKRVPVGAEIGMEACASAHYWARELQQQIPGTVYRYGVCQRLPFGNSLK